jgi:hypothetical protein
MHLIIINKIRLNNCHSVVVLFCSYMYLLNISFTFSITTLLEFMNQMSLFPFLFLYICRVLSYTQHVCAWERKMFLLCSVMWVILVPLKYSLEMSGGFSRAVCLECCETELKQAISNSGHSVEQSCFQHTLSSRCSSPFIKHYEWFAFL